MTFSSNEKGKKASPLAKGLRWFLLIAFAVIQIFPLVWLINFSLVSNQEMFTQGLLVWPKEWKWSNYVLAFRDGHVLHYFLNSLLINVLAVFLVLLISLMMAFAVTRMRWKLSTAVKGLIMLGMMIPIHATLLPNYVIYSRLHMIDTPWALLVPYVAFSLPQGLFLTSSFMESLPVEVEESAMLDGCGIYQILFTIVTPMMKSSLSTVAIMTFLNNWNEFMMASTYLNSDKWRTLPFSVLQFTGMYTSNYAAQFAVMALSAAPVVVIYLILNRQITEGVAMGAVKG